jgi:hypothetical protein
VVVGAAGAKGVTTQVFHSTQIYIYIYIYVCVCVCVCVSFLQSSPEVKQKKKRGAQSHGQALESSASYKHLKTRATTGRAS